MTRFEIYPLGVLPGHKLATRPLIICLKMGTMPLVHSYKMFSVSRLWSPSSQRLSTPFQLQVQSYYPQLSNQHQPKPSPPQTTPRLNMCFKCLVGCLDRPKKNKKVKQSGHGGNGNVPAGSHKQDPVDKGRSPHHNAQTKQYPSMN